MDQTPASDFLTALRSAVSQVRENAQTPRQSQVNDRTGRLRITVEDGVVSVELDQELVADSGERVRVREAVREATAALLASQQAAVQLSPEVQESLARDADAFFSSGQEVLQERLRDAEERFGRFRRA